jgi:hypothetical protein
MKLWILRPLKDDSAPWLPYFDRMFGFVIRAESEDKARSLAASNWGDEGPDAWLSSRLSTCVELRADGPAGVILESYNMTGATPSRTKRRQQGRAGRERQVAR